MNRDPLNLLIYLIILVVCVLVLFALLRALGVAV